jgi:hypothetical protein
LIIFTCDLYVFDDDDDDDDDDDSIGECCCNIKVNFSGLVKEDSEWIK